MAHTCSYCVFPPDLQDDLHPYGSKCGKAATWAFQYKYAKDPEGTAFHKGTTYLCDEHSKDAKEDFDPDRRMSGNLVKLPWRKL